MIIEGKRNSTRSAGKLIKDWSRLTKGIVQDRGGVGYVILISINIYGSISPVSL